MSQEASVIASADQPGDSPKGGAEQDSVDLDALARRVLDLLVREVRIERERIGSGWNL